MILTLAVLILTYPYKIKSDLSARWKHCSDYDRCLEIDFQDGGDNDTALLTSDGTFDCIFSGLLENEGVNVVVTSDCPYEKYSSLEVRSILE